MLLRDICHDQAFVYLNQVAQTDATVFLLLQWRAVINVNITSPKNSPPTAAKSHVFTVHMHIQLYIDNIQYSSQDRNMYLLNIFNISEGFANAILSRHKLFGASRHLLQTITQDNNNNYRFNRPGQFQGDRPSLFRDWTMHL